MKINHCTNQLFNNYNIYSTKQNNNIRKNNRHTSPTFKASATEIERMLARKGITCDFGGNSFVADCVKRTVDVFESLFGRSSLPREVNYKYIGNPAEEGLAQYWAYYDRVDINAADSCFNNKQALQNAMYKHKKVLGMPTWLSSSHYLHPVIHEFGHGAHFHNIEKNNNEYAWDWMSNKIHNAVGQLITKFKLSKYANYNLKEFMAERISKDICTKLNYNDKYTGYQKDVDYSHIFSNKWNCRYSTPQAYLDYYTQQIWNGDMDEAENAAGRIDVFLKEIERESYKSTRKQSNFWGIIDEVAGMITGQAKWLDKINRANKNKL